MVNDTALALQALNAVNYSNTTVISSALDYLISTQNTDGGWGFYQGDDSNVYMTALVHQTLSQFKETYNLTSPITNAAAYLLAHQNADGGFETNGEGGTSTVFETAMAVIGLIQSGQGQAQPLQNAINWLIAAQLPNGSWNDDPYSTALALRALAMVKPNLTLLPSDITFSNPAPTVGDTITITANIRNNGTTLADSIFVQFYSGDPNAGGTFIGDAFISSIGAYSSSPVSFTWTIPSAGMGTIYVKLDPSNTLEESSETDNVAFRNLTAATLPDLSISAADITFSSTTPIQNEPVTMSATIRNLGETAASNVAVDIYDGDPAAGGISLYSTIVPSIGGGRSYATQFAAGFSAGSHKIYVVLDRADSIREGAETNNTAMMGIEIREMPVADLSVRNMDLTFAPLNPTEGDIVTLTAVIHNGGDAPAGDVQVRFYLGDPEAGGIQIGSDQTIASIAARGTSTITNSWETTGHAGNNDIHIKVDPANMITETSKLNNKAFTTVIVAAQTGPDLVLTTPDLNITPLSATEGEMVTITANVKNTGTEDVNNIIVEFSLGDPKAGGTLIVGSYTISTIAQGSAATAQISWNTTGFSGRYEVYANVDPFNEIPELNEQNNVTHMTITVTEQQGPDLAITAIDTAGLVTDTQTLMASGSIMIAIQNKGNQPTDRAFEVTAFLDRNGNKTYDPAIDAPMGISGHAEPLAAGASASLAVPIEGSVPFMDYPITVIIDSGSAISELNETNNTRSTSQECESQPSVGQFNPVEKWAWISSLVLPGWLNVMMTPAVIDINQDGVPDVVFGSTNYGYGGPVFNGALRVLDGRSGAEIFTVTDPNFYINAACSIAVGDIDLDGQPEIVACDNTGYRLIAFNHDGTFKWRSEQLQYMHHGAPSLADLDGDGIPEIIIGRQVLDNTGRLLWTGSGGSTGTMLSTVADINMDGKLDVVAGSSVYNSDGSLLCNTHVADGRTAVGNFNGDPYPEIVMVNTGSVWLLDHTCKVIWGKTNPGGGGGAPTLADFDGDGQPEIGVAGSSRYVVFKADGTILWQSTIRDTSYLTGSSVFDFDGDGKAEVVYRDEVKLRVYRGTNGEVLFENLMSSCTWYEYVIVADVDGDNKAEIVAVANNACGFGHQQGIHVLGDANNTWVNTRKIWNQHSYHITNVNDDGTIPRHEENSWERYNSYRCNSMLPEQALAIPDITVSLITVDQNNYPASLALSARIGNGGALAQGAGIDVEFYDGDPRAGGRLIGSTTTSRALAPGEYEDVVVHWNDPAPAGGPIFAVADGQHKINECRQGNNLASSMTKADIEIIAAEVSLTPGTPNEGQTVTITSPVHNRGGQKVLNVLISIYDGDPATGGILIGSTTLAEILPGSSADATIQWNTLTQGGMNYLHIIADPDDAIEEMSETNNSALVSALVALPSLPDLEIRAEDVSVSDSLPQAGDLMTVTAGLRNVGLSAGPVDVCLYDGNPNAGGALMSCKGIMEIIHFGAMIPVSFGIAAPASQGHHQLYVVADPANGIGEGDETNNSASFPIFVARQSLGLNITTDKTAYSAKENMRITVEIINTSLVIDPSLIVSIEDSAGNKVASVGSATPERRAFGGWAYRIPAQVTTGYALQDALAETTLSFAEIFGSLGVVSWTVDTDSIRVGEIDAAGNYLGEKEAKATFLGDNKARIIWLMDGLTAGNIPRHFHIYFDILENGSKPQPQKTAIPSVRGFVAYSDGYGKIYTVRINGDGTFGAPVLVDYLTDGAYDMGTAVDDFNNDGFKDLITGSGSTGRIYYYQNKGDGIDSFLPKQEIGSITAGGSIQDTAVADFDDDGYKDVAISGYSDLYLFKGKGDGTFTISKLPSPVADNTFRGKTAADIDGDGRVDLLVALSNTGSIYIYKGKGDGTFAAPALLRKVGSRSYGIAAGDFDADGQIDIIAQDSNTYDEYLMKGDGTLANPAIISSLYTGFINDLEAGDFNGDGRLDIMAGTYSHRTLEFFAGNGDGAFQASNTIATTPGGYLIGVSACVTPYGVHSLLGNPQKLTPDIIEFVWNVGSTMAGDYRVHGVLTGGQAVLDAYADFTILPDSTVDSRITADRISYTANQPVTLTSTITSQSANYIFTDLTAKIAISSQPSAMSIYEETKPILTLLPGQMEELKTYWNTGTYPPGTYTATLEVKDSSGALMTSSSTTITISGEIKPSKLLKGTISVDRQHILQGDPVTISYNITNAGNMDLPAIDLKILTVHAVNQNIYDTLTDHASLMIGQTHNGSQPLQTTSYSAKDYLVILRADIGGIEETLAGTYIRVEGAPSAPSLNGPEGGSDVQTLTPVLTVNNASDPNDDRLTYEFELYKDSGLTDPVTSSGSTPESNLTTAWQVPMTLTENATYYWRARAYDGLLYSDWMAPAGFRVNVENDPPTAPTLSWPADNSSVDTLTPVLTVTNSSDPDSTNLTYNFEVSTDAAFGTITASKIGIFETPSTTFWQVDIPLQENTWYYWRAKADDWLATGPWMAPARFFVNTTNEAPSKPAIVSPAQGSSVAALEADIISNNSIDPDSTGLTYLFELDTAATFDTPALQTSGSIQEGQGSTLWHVQGLQDNTRYFARVKANDGQAESPWSDTVSFFANTVNDAPTAPSLANPSDGGAVSIATPTLTVHNSTDADGDALTYDFELYGDSSMTNLVTSATAIQETPETTSWVVPIALTENQTYYWRTRAYDGQAYGSWMPQASFFVNTANDAPNAPVLYAPAQGSTIQTLTPTLSVNNSIDPDSDTLTYDFEVYSGTTLVKSVTGITAGTSGITSAAVTLSDNTTYTWRARAYDGDRYSGWMDTAAFSIHMPVTGITATMDFDPNTLNKKSNGNWVTVYIELPAGYDVSAIDIASLRLEDTIPAELWPYAIGDQDHDGIKDLMVKFIRAVVINILPSGDNVKVHLKGKVGTATFEGVDTIRVIK